MADTSHLEKMATELKCPICLSLFESAVSLVCNHVFCSACIVKSMKSGSNCPVCKVPERDSSCSSHGQLDEGKKDDDNDHRNRDEVSAQDVSLDPCKPNKRGLSKAQPFDPRDRFVQPSCPTKKRIQVPQHPPVTAPIRSQSANDGSVLIVGNKAKNCSDAISQKTEQFFEPFFWLRDDDADKGSQYSDKDLLTDSSPLETPCFSDIKDGEDDVAVNSMAVLAEATEREIKASSHRSCADEGHDDIQMGTAADNAMPIEVPSHMDEGNLNKSSMSKKRGRKAGGKSQRKSRCTKTNQPAAVHSTKVILNISQTMPTCESFCRKSTRGQLGWRRRRSYPGRPRRKPLSYTASRCPVVVKLLPKEQTSSTEGCLKQRLLPVQRLQRLPATHGSLIPLQPTSCSHYDDVV